MKEPTWMEQLEASYAQCKRAFLAAPTPRLGAALKQIERKMQYERRRLREQQKGVTA